MRKKRFALYTAKADEEFGRRIDGLLIEYSARMLSRQHFVDSIAEIFLRFEKEGSLDTQSRGLAEQFINRWMAVSDLDSSDKVFFDEIENKLLLHMASRHSWIKQGDPLAQEG